MIRQRLHKTTLAAAPWLTAAVLYNLLVRLTPIRIPCLFRVFTGFQCPGCGMTRMCIALLSGQLQEAVQYNPVLFFMLPFLILYVFIISAVFILTGKQWHIPHENLCAYGCIAILLTFGVLRNLFGW